MDEITAKTCSKCKETKPKSDFYKHARSSDGLGYRCRQCESKRARDYQQKHRDKQNHLSLSYYHQNKDRISERRKERYRENKDRENAYSRRYYEENREGQIERLRVYREQNPDYFKHWRAENGLKLRLQRDRRRASLNEAEGSYTEAEIWCMVEDQEHLCAYCETPLYGEFHVDHIIPLSRGGTNDWTNLAITCPACNLSKGTQAIEVFIARLSTDARVLLEE